MDDKLKNIIDSGLLEAHFLGLSSNEESKRVEKILKDHPELRSSQDALEKILIEMTDSISMEPPSGLKGNIDEAINLKPQEVNVTSSETITKSFNWKPFVVGFLVTALGWVAYQNFSKAKDLSVQLAESKKELKLQKIQNLEMNSQMSKLIDEFEYINNSNTKKYLLNGNDKAPNFKLVAYWNENIKKSSIALSGSPNLPAGKCLQMWADVEGKMISVGVIDETKEFASIDFLENAESLNITIEPKGGSLHPNVSMLVASIII